MRFVSTYAHNYTRWPWKRSFNAFRVGFRHELPGVRCDELPDPETGHAEEFAKFAKILRTKQDLGASKNSKGGQSSTVRINSGMRDRRHVNRKESRMPIESCVCGCNGTEITSCLKANPLAENSSWLITQG